MVLPWGGMIPPPRGVDMGRVGNKSNYASRSRKITRIFFRNK